MHDIKFLNDAYRIRKFKAHTSDESNATDEDEESDSNALS